MAGTGWRAQLDDASNEDDVAAVCNRFLNAWTAEELFEIPTSCLPEEPIEWGAIAQYAIRLIAAVGVGNRASAPMLYKMSTFFTKAALRLADVMSVRTRGSARGRTSGEGSSSAEG